MTTSEYLYEAKPDTWDNMLYFEALEDKYQRSKKLYEKMLEKEWNSKTEMSYEFRIRLHKVRRAMDFNKELLEERYSVV